ncbi:hypothetical protein H0H81_002122 [Sphagnurus paluster]|uniref:Uncharacterized protein n=1 Tax=Sphagnurus paluster TaxID=117069 RepID=A0A9P7KLV1_9AGAR|nr:hypothetical protein H0H81_002122 [Sphagnurus paluster]
MPKAAGARSIKAKSNQGQTKEQKTRPPNIKWVKNSDWMWSLITYLTDHPAFCKKLQYAVLTKHIFEHDAAQAEHYTSNPARFGTSVETRLWRLKKEYTEHLKTLGVTGAGLDPKDIIPGSEIDNLVKQIKAEWEWFDEFHAFWRELPNYNPIAVESSTPGVDHAAAAVAIFEGSAPDDGQNADCLEVRSGDGDEHAADELEEDDKEDDYEQVPQRADPEPPSANLEAILSASGLTKPATMTPKPSKIKAALSGCDAGLAKAATTTKGSSSKSAIDQFTKT